MASGMMVGRAVAATATTAPPQPTAAALDGGVPQDGGVADAGGTPPAGSDAGPTSSQVAAVDAGPSGPPPLYDDSGCVTCHADQVGKKEVHFPLRGNRGCVDCHVPGGDEGKCKSSVTKAWQDPPDEICTKCHDVHDKAPLHPVIKAAGCLPCHDAHTSDNPNLLIKWPVVTLCYSCHDHKDKQKDVHGAVAQGECLGCHDPHSGKEAPLLKRKKEELCTSCHQPPELFEKRVHHAPVGEGGCLQCHSPHQSDNPKLQLDTGNAACLKCHDTSAPKGPMTPGAAKRIDLTKPFVHAVLQVGTCQDCHSDGHSSDNSRLLKKPTPELCYSCHSREDGKRYTHGAVKVGDCQVCHDPHSSTQKSLIRQPTVQGLCFQCHADDITGRPFIHKPVQEGQCTKCHDPHGADNPFDLKAGEGKQFCYSCHAPKDDVKYKHVALERYGCTACHDPHASGNREQLIKPVNELCKSCHPDKVDGTHVSTMMPGGHRISGVPDTHDESKEFSCVSCHNAHGSDSPKLLRFGNEPSETCDWCHGDRTGNHPELKDISKRYRLKLPHPIGTGGDGQGAGGNVPGTGGDSTAPGTGGDVPGAGGSAPGTGGDVPGAGGAVPGTGGDAPGAGGDAVPAPSLGPEDGREKSGLEPPESIRR